MSISLAEQMVTSVKMIEDPYGHVNTVKRADPVLKGMGGWDQVVLLTRPRNGALWVQRSGSRLVYTPVADKLMARGPDLRIDWQGRPGMGLHRAA